MKWMVCAVLLLSGCVAIESSPTRQPDPSWYSLEQLSLLSRYRSPVAVQQDGSFVNILVTHENPGLPPMIISLRAETEGLMPPLRYHWSLGNGTEWDGVEPPTQNYAPGRYDVVLTVTDTRGQVKKASVAIDSKSHGCGF